MVLSLQQIERVLMRNGFRRVSCSGTSHRSWVDENGRKVTTVDKCDENKFVFQSIVKQSGIPKEEFYHSVGSRKHKNKLKGN